MNVNISKAPKILFYTCNEGRIFYLIDVSDVIISYIYDDVWTFISESITLLYEELYRYRKYIDWKAYSAGYNELTYKIIENFRRDLVWPIILRKWIQKGKIISEKQVHFINKSLDVIKDSVLLNISINNKKWFYSEVFIDCFSDIVDWEWIVKNLKLPLLLIDRYFNKICTYDELYERQNISDISFLKEYRRRINWRKISKYQILSDDHFAVFPRLLDWEYILKNYSLNMKSLENLPKHIIYDNIYIISEKQPLTEQYIINNINILNPVKLLINSNISNIIHARILKSQVDEKYYFIIKQHQHIDFEY